MKLIKYRVGKARLRYKSYDEFLNGNPSTKRESAAFYRMPVLYGLITSSTQYALVLNDEISFGSFVRYLKYLFMSLSLKERFQVIRLEHKSTFNSSDYDKMVSVLDGDVA